VVKEVAKRGISSTQVGQRQIVLGVALWVGCDGIVELAILWWFCVVI